jgi:hypothetical protein
MSNNLITLRVSLVTFVLIALVPLAHAQDGQRLLVASGL